MIFFIKGPDTQAGQGLGITIPTDKGPTALMKKNPGQFFDTSINRIFLKFISYHLIKHFQILKCEVSLIKIVNNLKEAARMKTNQQQQNRCALSCCRAI